MSKGSNEVKLILKILAEHSNTEISVLQGCISSQVDQPEVIASLNCMIQGIEWPLRRLRKIVLEFYKN